jgi:SAM-dependent methyltransferase
MEPGEYERIFRLETTHFWYRGLHSLVLRLAERHAHAVAGQVPKILDAGCGTGGLAARLATHGRVTAIDVSPLAVAFSRRRGIDRLVRGSVVELPFRRDAFDFIVSTDVLYHRAVDDDKTALRELARVCRPGGFLCVTVAAHEWLRSEHDAVVHTARRYELRDVVDLAHEARLDVVRASYFNALLLPVAMATRLTSSRARRPPTAAASAASDLRPLPRPLNALLTSLFDLEARLVARRSLPFGLSILALLQKPTSGSVGGSVLRRSD